MAKSPNAADKAWITRRANGNGPVASNATTAERHPDIELIMSIGLGLNQSDNTSEITCSFMFANKGKPVDPSSLSADDRALLSIRLMACTTTADSKASIVGHDRTMVCLSSATVADLESILPRMKLLDSALATAFEQSEDSSLGMAIQAISWDLRVQWIDYNSKRTKRGIAYTIGESITDSVMALYATNG
jgi:hypothetical protein